MGVKVRKRGGAWWVFVDHRGSRKAKRIGASKEVAEAVAAKIQLRLLDAGVAALEISATPPISFESYARNWLDSYAAQVCKPNTVRFYKMNLERHIFPLLGAKPLMTISRVDCKTIIAACRERPKHRAKRKHGAELAGERTPEKPASLKGRTIEGVCRTLSAVLSHAVDDGHMQANPAFRLGRHIQRKRHDAAADIQALSFDEAAKLLVAAKDHCPREYPLVLAALRTGMRMGELLGLKWGDIDFESRLIHVRRNRTAGEVTTPKNGKTRRVDMSAKLTEELRGLLKRRKEEKLAKGWKELPDWVFCTLEGSPVDGDNLRHRVFYKVIEKAGIRRVRFHDLRHTFASMLIQNGESLAYVRDQLGHSSIQVTVDIYGHLVPGANRQAVDRLDLPQQSATPAQPDAASWN